MKKALLLLAALALVPLAGCSVLRERPTPAEEREAVAFFSSLASRDVFPAVASFSGTAERRGDLFPFIAGVRAEAPGRETAGVYDPLGRVALLLDNDGNRIAVSTGPAGEPFSSLNGRSIGAGPVSLARILSGLPGYPVRGGEVRRGKDGGWILDDGRQKLFSDPYRRCLARAEYTLDGRRVAVAYPGRGVEGAPGTVSLEAYGARIVLRRDEE